MFTWPCTHPGCALRTTPLRGDCHFCPKHLCDTHNIAINHDCLSYTEKENYDRRICHIEYVRPSLNPAKPLSGRGIHQKTSSHEINIEGQAQLLRPGHSCIVTYPTTWQDIRESHGTQNYMVPVDFDDGVQWLARVRKIHQSIPPPEIRRAVIDSEIKTMQITREAGLRVPKVFVPLHSKGGLHWFFMERIGGSTSDSPLTVEVPKPEGYEYMNDEFASNYFNDLATFYIALSELKFPAIGMIKPSDDELTTDIGPLFPQTRHEVLRRWFGPFKSNRDRYLSQINHVLECILTGIFTPTYQPVETYLIHLELRGMVLNDPEPGKEDTEFFISHQDADGDHILVADDGHIEGIIDWEWAIISTEEEAFCAPLEATEADIDRLAGIFEERNRNDLAACTRNSWKYKCLTVCIGSDYKQPYEWSRFKTLVHIMTGRKVYGDMALQIFCETLREKFGDDEGLVQLLEGI